MMTRFTAFFIYATVACAFSDVTAAASCGTLAPADIASLLNIDSEHKTRRSDSPNIIIILADDLSYSLISAYGGEIPTPNIDRLGREGARFTSGYSASSVCSPSRAALLTGKWPAAIPHFLNVYDQHRHGLSPDEITMAERFSDLGYATGMVGKWHLGRAKGYNPEEAGFDEYFAGYNFAESAVNELEAYVPGISSCREISDYINEIEGILASSFILKNQDIPFFLYLSLRAAHESWLIHPESFYRRFSYRIRPSYFKNIFSRDRRSYYTKIHYVDAAVGKVLDTIDFSGLAENTLIWFLSDNGGPGLKTTGYSQHPLRNHKGSLYEGGIRVPFMARWTGTIPSGIYEWPVQSMDILPTSLAAVKADFSRTGGGYGGIDILPYLKGDRSSFPVRYLYWKHRYTYTTGERINQVNSAVRYGDWKMLTRKLHGITLSRELYNLRNDAGETDNLASQADFVSILMDLTARLDASSEFLSD